MHFDVISFVLGFVAGGLCSAGIRSPAPKADVSQIAFPKTNPNRMVDGLIKAGRKIEAVEQYRKQNPGVGLETATDTIEMRRKELGL